MKHAFPIYLEQWDVRLMWIFAFTDFIAIPHEADSAEAKKKVIPSRQKIGGCGILNFSTSAKRESSHCGTNRRFGKNW